MNILTIDGQYINVEEPSRPYECKHVNVQSPINEDWPEFRCQDCGKILTNVEVGYDT